MNVEDTDRQRDTSRRARDAAIRRTRTIIAAIAAGAVALSGLFSVVAAQAFKGHQQGGATAAPAADAPAPVPAEAGADPAPLQPPAQPPTASGSTDAAPGPAPQVSGGS